MNKAPDAFRTISEVADYLETPSHVLRFWETRFPQVKPVKGAGGRRYYRPSDVALLAGIRQLLHNDGMTIRGVQKILRDQGVRHVTELGAAAHGEDLPPPEALSDLLPPVRPPAEVVALRPAAPPEPEPADLAPLAGLEASDLPLEAQGLEPAAEALPDAPPDLDASDALSAEEALLALTAEDNDLPAFAEDQTAAPDTEALAPDEALPDALPESVIDLPPEALEAPDLQADPLAAIREALPLAEDDSAAADEPPAPAETSSFAPPHLGFGGFGLDLDVPRGGVDGFIAFSNGAEPAKPTPPQGLVAAEARPKRPAPEPAPLQTSLFDLPGVEEAPEDQALNLLEAIAGGDDLATDAMDAPEAPHVFVDTEDSLAEISAFPQANRDEDPEALEPGDDLQAAEPEQDEDTLAEFDAESPAPDAQLAEPILPEGTEEELSAQDPAESLALDPEAQSDEEQTGALPAEELQSAQVPHLAGIAAALRARDRIAHPELADLQARLGLLHAQMVEAAARHRRPSA